MHLGGVTRGAGFKLVHNKKAIVDLPVQRLVDAFLNNEGAE
jgi:hypothetical protein